MLIIDLSYFVCYNIIKFYDSTRKENISSSEYTNYNAVSTLTTMQ